MKRAPKPLTEPWAISETGMQLVLAVWSRGELFARVRDEALAARGGKPLGNSVRAYERDGVAVIPVMGPLFRHASMMTELSAASSYAALRRDLQVALESPAVEQILLDVSSPGGEVEGLAELADAIRAADAVKPVTAYVGGFGASAAYWLASAARRIVAAETAELGSIGVRISLLDWSTVEEEGNAPRTVEIVSSQSPDKRSRPVDDELLARLQQRADELAAIFVRAVARNRGVDEATVIDRFGRGDVLLGAQAVAVGMADALGNFEGVLAELKPERPQTITITGASKMSEKTETPGTITAEEHSALTQFRAQVLAATGAATAEEAIGKVVAGAEALRDLPGVRADLAKAQAELTRRDLRATLEEGLALKRLSLGAIQKTLPLFVASEGKRAEVQAALGKIAETTREAVLDAFCSVDIGASDLRTIQSYAKSAAPTVATPAEEPERTDKKDAEDLDETAKLVAAEAEKARKAMDRGTAAKK